MQNRLGNQQGSALIYVIVVMFVSVILGLSALAISEQHVPSEYQTNQLDAIHIAESGIHEYLWALNAGNTAHLTNLLNNSIAYDTGEFDIDLIETGDGYQIVKSRGKVHGNLTSESERSIEVMFAQESFTRFSYLTKSEGSNIWWGSNDSVYGPFGTKDILRIDGNPNFYGHVTYEKDIVIKSGSNPIYHQGISKESIEEFPQNNTYIHQTAIERESKNTETGKVFVGRTAFLFKGDGTIRVRNHNENSGNAFDINIPEDGIVIYVNGNTTTDFEVRNDNRFNLNKGNAFVSGTVSGKVTIAAADSIFITGRDPTNYSFEDATVTDGITYEDTELTLDSTDGSITVENPDKDMLGLIANNNVWILTHDWLSETGRNANINSASEDININAAIFAINHSFGNESATSWGSVRPTSGGLATVKGAIIMNQRHAMAYFNGVELRGYDKLYAYDPRMEYETPPGFVDPTTSGYKIYRWIEN